jgi:5'-methylthioadenosine phosphorylase
MTDNNNKKLPLVKIGIIGGTGLYQIDGLKVLEEIDVDTPFGKPSDSFVIGMLAEKKVAFLSRHGRGHHILPLEINYQANIYGFKMLGVERILSVNSVGSLKEEIRPQDIVLSDQFYDRTRRKNTFFGNGAVAHVSFAQPVCPDLSEILYKVGQDLGLRIHSGGTNICIEGPSFSTKAESNIYRSWGCDVIGMTSVTEAKLSREAEICYATMSLVTDYDVWHEDEETVSVDMILENMAKNVDNAKALIKKAVSLLPERDTGKCDCMFAVKNCIVTKADLIPQETREKLRYIIGKYDQSMQKKDGLK